MTMNTRTRFAVTTGGAAALVALVAGLIVTTRPAHATAQFAAQTGLACGACHTDPKGGGALTPVGDKFKANGNKMPK